MAEENLTHSAAEHAELGIRSQLLMPIIEGHTLESEDVSRFLAGRLPAAKREGDPHPGARLS